MRRHVLLVLGLLALAGAAEPVTAEQAVANLEKAIRSVRTLQARFEQLQFSVSVSTPLSEKGQIYFEKPDRMRWDYKNPQVKAFLYQNGLFEMYIPEEKQLTRRRVEAEALESEIYGIFFGTMSFKDAYIVEGSLFPTDSAGVKQVKLTPRTEGDYSHILLEIDQKTWLLRRAVFVEWAGGRREFIFSRVRTGVRLPPGVFELKVPPDTEIIDEERAPGAKPSGPGFV